MTRTERRKLETRQRRLLWWKHHCLEIVALLILGIGFLAGWFVRDITYPAAEPVIIWKEPVETDEPEQEVEEQAMTEVFYWDVPMENELQDYIRELSAQYGVPSELILAVIAVESSFDPEAVSLSHDYGLMQINQINHEWLEENYGIKDIMDPYQNILGGTIILASHLDRFDTMEEAVMAYNRGASGASKLIQQGITSTEYSQEVMSRYQRFKEEAAPGTAIPESGK